MPYVIDRRRALLEREIVAIVRSEQRGLRSRVVLRDNGLYQTLTRPATLLRALKGQHLGIVQIGARGRRRTKPSGSERWL